MEESRASVDILVKTEDPNLDAHTENGGSMPHQELQPKIPAMAAAPISDSRCNKGRRDCSRG
jgi:hypothetical protein